MAVAVAEREADRKPAAVAAEVILLLEEAIRKAAAVEVERILLLKEANRKAGCACVVC
jgi:hypothetical protein